MNSVQNNAAQGANTENSINNVLANSGNEFPLEIAPRGVQFKRKRPAKANLWQTVGKARRMFDIQVTKTSDVKIACLKKCIESAGTASGSLWFEYKSKVERLTDSMSFNQKCKDCDLNPQVTAEHIVFSGFTTYNRVVTGGFEPMQVQLQEYKESFLAITSEK